MAHPSTGSLRILRAAVLGSAAFALALSAHVAAGGRAPSLAFAWVLVIACGGVSFGLTSRRLGPAAISTTLGVFQLGLHYSFMWLSSGACVAGSPAGIAPIHEHGGHAQGLSCVPMAAGMSAVGQVPTTMLGAHVVATVATAFALAHGERVLWLMFSAVWTAFHAVGPVLILPAKRRSEPLLTAGVGVALVALGGIGRRGPPASGLFV